MIGVSKRLMVLVVGGTGIRDSAVVQLQRRGVDEVGLKR